MSRSSMMLLHNFSKLVSSVRYLNFNLVSPNSKFEVVWHLQWKFELKPFYNFLVLYRRERKLFACACQTFLFSFIFSNIMYIIKFQFFAFSMYRGKANFAKYSFINYFILFITDITGRCFYFAFNFCNIFVNIIFRPSTLNQNLMQLCIILLMEWKYVFCARSATPNLFCLIF